MKVGRNDPCPCGSGKKYKQCCLPKQEVISLQAVREDRLYEGLMDGLLAFSSDLPPEEGMADGVVRYFGGPGPDQPTEAELMEPMDWVHFGYRSPATGTTLAERMAGEVKRLSEQEREMLRTWATGAIPGLFVVLSVGPKEVRLRRLGDAAQEYVVNEPWDGLETGDLVAVWLLPGPWGLRFGFYQGVLQAEVGHLEHLLHEEMSLLRCQRPTATWADLYRANWPRLIDAASLAGEFGEACLQIRYQTSRQIQGEPQPDPIYQDVASRLTETLLEIGAHAEEAAGARRLWWDAVHALRPRIQKVEPWVGAVVYLLFNAVYTSGETQAETAELVGTSAGSVGSRSREIREALNLQLWDPRYADLLGFGTRIPQRLSIYAQLDAAAAVWDFPDDDPDLPD